MPNTCYNYLKITGEEADILKFCNEVMLYGDDPVEHLKFDDCDYFITDKNDDFDHEIQSVSYVKNYVHHVEEISYVKNYLQLCFETDWTTPYDFIKRIMTEYSTLTFELRYEDGIISGVMESYLGEITVEKEGQRGMFYGESECEYCDECIDYGEYFCYKFNCCKDCEEEINDSILIIDRFIHSKKINKNLSK
jgi:hypothetical protein